jgi:hypothetical protein
VDFFTENNVKCLEIEVVAKTAQNLFEETKIFLERVRLIIT